MLAQLSQLSVVSFGVHSCWGSELDGSYPDLEQWEYLLQLPPLGSVAALTELCLAGYLQLPPDFRQLSQLRRLTVAGAISNFEDDDEHFAWGDAPLTGLAALTRLDYGYMDLPGGS